jgi:flagellar biosynthesis regulator FlaF
MDLLLYKATDLAKEDNKVPKTIRTSKKYIPVYIKPTKKTVAKKNTKRYLRRSDVLEYLKENN